MKNAVKNKFEGLKSPKGAKITIYYEDDSIVEEKLNSLAKTFFEEGLFKAIWIVFDKAIKDDFQEEYHLLINNELKLMIFPSKEYAEWMKIDDLSKKWFHYIKLDFHSLYCFELKQAFRFFMINKTWSEYFQIDEERFKDNKCLCSTCPKAPCLNRRETFQE